MPKVMKFESEVLESKQVSPGVMIFRFSKPIDFSFEPGQYVSVIISINGAIERRSYSISGMTDEYIETAVDKVEHGRVSPWIHELKKGDKVTIQGPLGVFVLKNDAVEKENVFIATGTGITPFISMISALLSKTKKKVMLLAGYRHEEDVLFAEELKALQKYPNFSYHVILSQPNHGEKGYVQDLLEKYVSDDFSGDFYLCGLFNMIKDVGQLLTKKNIPKERIIFERYD